MNRISFSRRPWLLILTLAVAAAAPNLAAFERNFSTSATLSTEAALLMQLLDRAHYNHAAIHSTDYAQVIPDYMTALDGQHLFFLASDEARFAQQYGSSVYYNVAYLGNLDPAYEIYYTFETRIEARVNWIFDELKKNADFTAEESLAADRSKADWPSNLADADSLWHRRLKFELLAEILNKKTPEQARQIVRKRYERMLKNLGDSEAGDLAELYLSCITKLFDPHSEYYSADSFEEFGIQMKLHLDGIGAMLGSKDDYCTVEELVPGGPADLGHQLKPHDKIISVAQDGKEPVEVIGMKLRKIVTMIRGPKGTRVHLVVQPANATDPSARKEIIITRDVVKLNSARAHAAIFEVPGAGGKDVPIGVIGLPEFYGAADDAGSATDKTSATQDVARLIGQMERVGIQGLVLDLRHNGGGFLTEAINLTGLFIHPGPVVQVRESGGDINVDSDDASHAMYTGPLAVLVDRFSASASEIVAGALQNYGRAIIVGDSSTHGKGTVQTVLEMRTLSHELADSPAKTGAAKITVQKFYLPNGSSTQLKGVVPDIILPSIDEYLPLGESSLPHALVWDRIPGTSFDGTPLDPKTLAALRGDSLARQSQLEEFTYLNKIVDWFKDREEEKSISLNLDEREKQKTADDLFRKEITAERDRLEKNDYVLKEFRLGPVPPKIKPLADDDSGVNPDDPDDDNVLGADEDTESFGKMDVHLRETLRILNDAIDLGQNRAFWAADHAPLTIAQK